MAESEDHERLVGREDDLDDVNYQVREVYARSTA